MVKVVISSQKGFIALYLSGRQSLIVPGLNVISSPWPLSCCLRMPVIRLPVKPDFFIAPILTIKLLF
jgi:hypothetical protein